MVRSSSGNTRGGGGKGHAVVKEVFLGEKRGYLGLLQSGRQEPLSYRGSFRKRGRLRKRAWGCVDRAGMWTSQPRHDSGNVRKGKMVS